MAEELMPIYEENVRGDIAQGESDRSYLVQRVIAQNTDLIDGLEARTDSLIDTIMIERADTENALQTYQKELIQEQVDQVRDIEKRVTETKEAILKAIDDAEKQIKQTEREQKQAEWELKREEAHKKHLEHHHHSHHRFSHYGYGYHSYHQVDNTKQVKEAEDKISGLKTKITGFKEKITSLKAQVVQFKEDWTLSLKDARTEFSALQGDSLSDWEKNLALAKSDYAAVLDAKEEIFARESEFAKKSWEGVLAAARDEFDTKISALIGAMEKASAGKKAAVQAMYDELLEKIETLHEKKEHDKHHHDIKFGHHDEHAKHELRKALDDKLDAIQKRCKAQEAEINAFGPAIRARFADELAKEDKRFKKVTHATAAQCTAAIDDEEAAISKSTFAYN